MRVVLLPILLAAIQSQVKIIHPSLAIMMLALSIGGAVNIKYFNFHVYILYSC